MKATILLVLLAGGVGRRMGGGKAERRVAGERLVDRAIRRSRHWGLTSRLALRAPEQVRSDLPAILDDPDVPGPLAGLFAGLREARALDLPLLLTLPCDMPFFPADLPQRLDDALGPAAAALARSGGRLHPICGLWRVEAAARQALAPRPDHSLRGFATRLGHVEVGWPADPVDPFFNVNREEELERAERILAAGQAPR